MEERNGNWVERAHKVFPGGALGAFALPSGQEVIMTRGQGAELFDSEGHSYLDYILGSGPMILGHAHPAVVAAVRAQLDSGSQFYTINDTAIRLALGASRSRIVSLLLAESLLELGVGLGGDSSPRMFAFQARLEF